MDIGELSELTGISVRRLRYCLDHELIPGLNLNLQHLAVGRARRFAQDAGLGFACAALLQELGLPHPKIRLFLQNVLDEKMEKGGHSAPALASQQDVQGLRRRDQNMRSFAEHRRSFALRCVAGTHQDANFWKLWVQFRQFAQRSLQILLDVVAQRPQRRDIQYAGFVWQRRTLTCQAIDGGQVAC